MELTHSLLRVFCQGFRTANTKVSLRWLFGALEDNLDQLLRLEILSGAFGQDFYKGSPGQGLNEAQAYLVGKVHPAWLLKANSGLYQQCLQRIESTFDYLAGRSPRENIPRGDAEDVMQSLLAGLTPVGHKVAPYKVFVWFGEELRVPILDRAPPKQMAYVLRNILRNATWNVWKAKDMMSADAETGGRNFQTPEPPPNRDVAPADLLLDIVFHDRADPLGKKIRAFMRESWKGLPQQKAMDLWLDTFEKTGRIPKKQDISDAAGYAQPISFSRAWKVAWAGFYKKLWQNSTLLRALQDRFAEEDIAWAPKMFESFDKVLEESHKSKTPHVEV